MTTSILCLKWTVKIILYHVRCYKDVWTLVVGLPYSTESEFCDRICGPSNVGAYLNDV